MTSVCVVDAAVVTAFGDGLDPLWDGLLAGRSAIAPLHRFAVDRYQSQLAACVPELSSAAGESRIVPLLERLLAQLGPVPADCRVLTATTKGGIDSLEKLRRGEVCQADAVLPGDLPARVAVRMELADSGLNINAACASSTLALARGAAQIAAGAAEAVLVVGIDLVSEFVFSGFSSLQALSVAASRPFDAQRSGLTLGEGGAALLLMNEERARRDGRSVLGRVLGWGSANDANHITAPARDGCGLVDAVGRALAKAGLSADAVAAVSAHGTGTVYNDAMELTAFGRIFGGRRLPVNSVKGALGHTLGAAGAIEVVLGLRSLAERQLPPTVGLIEPEEAGRGLVAAVSQGFAGDCLLSTNSGFGGVNAALVLGGAPC
ncbi:beta-ketoacyl synthase N-terminal-like domain-containing protein [Trichloromonas sp.]|uniref:beta-ketoacyl synthase N-terminal-like domain-containing protein n=1 Tax=Trichloromonas sp. TaxID=3069249 RepID=UPI003D815E8A